MTNAEVKTLHDDIINRFGLNKDRLLGFLYQLSSTAVYQRNDEYMCVYPADPGDVDFDSMELAIYNKHMGGFVRSGIYFKSHLEELCVETAMKINQEIYGLDLEDVSNIVEQNQEIRKQKQNKRFNRALAKIVSIMPPEQILSTPGCYEALSEEYNNEVLDVVQMYNADPALNNLELKYSSREMLEMLVTDLENLTTLIEEVGLDQEIALPKSDKQKIESAEQSLTLARGFLKNMNQISHT